MSEKEMGFWHFALTRWYFWVVFACISLINEDYLKFTYSVSWASFFGALAFHILFAAAAPFIVYRKQKHRLAKSK